MPDALQPLACAVMLAEFDIDKGSTLAAVVPTAANDRILPSERSAVAELMLPEGAHLRHEDASYFVLPPRARHATNQDINENILISPQNEPRIHAVAYIKLDKEWTLAADTEIVLAFRNSDSLIVIHPKTLVEQSWNIHHATCEYWNEFTIFFRSVSPQIVVKFRNTDDRVWFMQCVHELAFVIAIEDPLPQDLPQSPISKDPLLYVINMINMKHIAGARRSARVKSIAIASRHPWVHVFKPLLILALDQYFAHPSEQILIDLFNVLNAADTRFIPILSMAERKTLRILLRSALSHHPANFYQQQQSLKYHDPHDEKLELLDYISDPELPVFFGNVLLPIKLPIASYPCEFGDFSMSTLFNTFMHTTLTNTQHHQLKTRNDVPYTYHPHLDIGPQTHPIIILMFALLTEKRVLFVGHGRPCNEIANCVLACIAIASGGGAIPNVITRCFPYTSLASLDKLLAVPGYIAGVTNPVFEEQPSWWDILCNLNTRKITISLKLISASLPIPNPPVSSSSSAPPLQQQQHASVATSVMQSQLPLSPLMQPIPLRSLSSQESGMMGTGNTASFDTIGDDDDAFLQKISTSIQRRHDEIHIRTLVYSFVERFIGIAYTHAEKPIQRIPPQWRNRAEGWLTTCGYASVHHEMKHGMRKTLVSQVDVSGAIAELLLGVTGMYGYVHAGGHGDNTDHGDAGTTHGVSRASSGMVGSVHGVATPMMPTTPSWTSIGHGSIHGGHVGDTGMPDTVTAPQPITPDRIVSLFVLLDDIVQQSTDDDLVEILSALPSSDGAALPFSLGLFHARPEIRMAAARIIHRLYIQKLGEQFVNPFIKFAVVRLLQRDGFDLWEDIDADNDIRDNVASMSMTADPTAVSTTMPVSSVSDGEIMTHSKLDGDLLSP